MSDRAGAEFERMRIGSFPIMLTCTLEPDPYCSKAKCSVCGHTMRIASDLSVRSLLRCPRCERIIDHER